MSFCSQKRSLDARCLGFVDSLRERTYCSVEEILRLGEVTMAERALAILEGLLPLGIVLFRMLLGIEFDDVASQDFFDLISHRFCNVAPDFVLPQPVKVSGYLFSGFFRRLVHNFCILQRLDVIW